MSDRGPPGEVGQTVRAFRPDVGRPAQTLVNELRRDVGFVDDGDEGAFVDRVAVFDDRARFGGADESASLEVRVGGEDGTERQAVGDGTHALIQRARRAVGVHAARHEAGAYLAAGYGQTAVPSKRDYAHHQARTRHQARRHARYHTRPAASARRTRGERRAPALSSPLLLESGD